MQATLDRYQRSRRCLAVLTTRELEERKYVVLRPTFLERPRWYLADFLVVALVVALVADLAPLATVSAIVAVAVAVVIAVIMSEPFHHETELVLAMSSTSTTSPNHTARLYRNPIWHNNSASTNPADEVCLYRIAIPNKRLTNTSLVVMPKPKVACGVSCAECRCPVQKYLAQKV